MATAPHIGEDPEAWLTLLWDSFSSRLFGAVLELWVAARTDDELRNTLLPYERGLRRTLRQLSRARTPHNWPDETFGRAFDMTLTYYRGLALTSVLTDAAHIEQIKQEWAKAVSHLLRTAE